RQLAALVGAVEADPEEARLGVRARQIAKSGQLPDTVRSPEAAIEDEHDLRATRGGERDRLSVLIDELEIRREAVQCDGEKERGDHALSISCRRRMPDLNPERAIDEQRDLVPRPPAAHAVAHRLRTPNEVDVRFCRVTVKEHFHCWIDDVDRWTAAIG